MRKLRVVLATLALGAAVWLGASTAPKAASACYRCYLYDLETGSWRCGLGYQSGHYGCNEHYWAYDGHWTCDYVGHNDGCTCVPQICPKP